MIQIRGLVKRYGAFTAVDSLDLNVPRGGIYGFLGPNGAGKTSTIMMVLGITRPTAGEIRLFGEAYTPNRIELRRRIGVVPEKHPRGGWQWMTAGEYLRLFADLFRVPQASRRIETLLERVALGTVRDKRIREFSQGMLQKLSFVRALLPDPDLLLLDEPISGLDPLGIKQVRDLILEENREGRTVFISSHQLSEMERLCNRVAIISRGRLMVEDEMRAVLSRIGATRELRVELEHPPGDLGERVGKLPFVRESFLQGNVLVVRVGREGDHRREVSEHLFRLGFVPLSLEERAPSLEEAFVTLTQENIALLAPRGRP
ncbi:MAG: hypothetical protein A2177_12475 [Spirochaetes bacterium RBG_13_68_11]|nr:MAG: hypothetical protein A2177_12475 [Spirochaetes bacterium RBG_13_68_11]